MIPAELTPDDEALLVAEGWTLVDGSAGDWRDPYTRDAVPAWRALELVRRDVGGVDAQRVLRRLAGAVEALGVTVLQYRLEVQRKVVRQEITAEDLAAVQQVTDRLRELGRETAGRCAPRGS